MGPDHINFRLDSIAMMNPKAMQDALTGSLEWDADAALAGIVCPWTLLVGNETLGGVVTAKEADRMEHEHPASHVIRVSDVGHLIHHQRPDAWLAAMNRLIDA